MATTVFDVTPEELESSANRIQEKITEFTKAYNSIYTATADLRVTYKGQASDVFNQRLEDYRNDFTAVEKSLNNYVEFLREYSKKVRSVEDSVKSRASSLSSGK